MKLPNAKTVQIAALVSVLSGGGLATIEQRYASASDLDGVVEEVQAARISALEFQVLQIELEIAQMEARMTSLSEGELVVLATLRNTRERYLRELSALRQNQLG